MVKRNLFKGLALFIVLTFVMSLAPAVCFAEGETASNIVFQIWQDKLLTEVDPSDGEEWASFSGNVTQEGGIKFLNKTTADYSAKDGTNAAAILHGNYNKSENTDIRKTYYVDFGADISSLVMANGYDKTFVSFYFQTLNWDKIDLSGFEIGAYTKDTDGNKVLGTAVPLTKYVHIMQDKWVLLEFSMKDLGLDGVNNTAFEGLYFNTKIKDDVTEFYSSVGKFDKLNIVNSVGDGKMVYDGTYKISPDLTFFKLGTDAMEVGYCRPNTDYYFENKKQEMLTMTYNTKTGTIDLATMSEGKNNTKDMYISICPVATAPKGNTLATMATYYDVTNTDLVLNIKQGAGYSSLVNSNTEILVGAGNFYNTAGSGWANSPLKMGLVALDKSKISANTADYAQFRIPLKEFIDASKNETTLLNEKNTENATGELSLDTINVFGIVLKNATKVNQKILLNIDKVGLAPHTESVENRMAYGDNGQKWGMPAGASEPLCYTLSTSGSKEKLYDTTSTERTGYGTSNKIIYTWAYWGNNIYTPEYAKIGIAFNQPAITSDNKIKFSMNNYTTTDVKPALVIAYYKDKELVDVQVSSDFAFVNNGSSSSTTKSISTDKEYDTVKAFMLDSMESIVPLAKSYDSTTVTE